MPCSNDGYGGDGDDAHDDDAHNTHGDVIGYDDGVNATSILVKCYSQKSLLNSYIGYFDSFHFLLLLGRQCF